MELVFSFHFVNKNLINLINVRMHEAPSNHCFSLKTDDNSKVELIITFHFCFPVSKIKFMHLFRPKLSRKVLNEIEINRKEWLRRIICSETWFQCTVNLPDRPDFSAKTRMKNHPAWLTGFGTKIPDFARILQDFFQFLPLLS